MSAVLHKLLDAGDLDALQREIEKAKNASSDPFSQFFVGTPPLQEKDDVDCVVPLTLAIMMRNVAAVRLLLEAKADVNRKCNGSSTLHAALLLGYYSNHRETAVEILGLLLDENPEVNVKDDRGETPLHQACEIGLDADVVSRLVERGGSQLLEAKDRTGARPIHKAAANGHSDVVNRLVDLNAEVGAANSLGNTPVHFAAMGGHWGTVRALLSRSCAAAATNKRGLTALELARKRGFQIPADVAAALEGKPVDAASAVAAADEDGTGDDGPKTLVITHPLCLEHKTCEKIERDESERPPENVCRLRVLVEPATGALRMASLEKHTEWCDEGPRVHIADVLRVHEYAYIKKLQEGCARVEPGKVVSLDGDTTVSRESFEAAMHAAGSVCAAVDRVCGGCNRNAFCAIRPPGHHAGYRGLVECEEEKHGSVGFCLLNNVAIGAAYARNVWRDRGIERVAIIDFDVHHGNGTEDCVRNLVPTTEEFPLSTPFSDVVVKAERYRPWLGEDDVDNVLFVSTHGYGRKMEAAQPGPMFYPGTGCTAICDVAGCPPKPFANLFGGLSAPPSAPAAAAGESKIINFGFALLSPDATPGTARLEWRDAYRRTILPKLAEFNPDLILISAGFDAHKKDTMACGFIGLLEDDYTWVTQQLVKVANKCCDGRIVSMLEGGYMTDGGPSSAFARSVAAHVGALTEGCVSLETWDENDAIWESAHENHLSRERERRRQLKAEKEAARIKKEFAELDGAAGKILEEEYGNAAAASATAGGEPKAEEGQAVVAAAAAPEPAAAAGGATDDSELPSPRKRSRRGGGSVDYVALAAKLDQEGK